MTEAPEKIWATKSMAGQLTSQHKNVTGEWATEYTRSDIADTLRAEIERLRGERATLHFTLAAVQAHMAENQ
jgi:hypothetical protein